MKHESEDEHLSRITTLWTELNRANRGPEAASVDAQAAFIHRYYKAAYRYLLARLRDPEAATEVFNEFALRFLQGKLRGADPQRGRFRDFLKAVLANLVANYYKARHKQPQALAPDHAGRIVDPPPSEADQAFLTSLREELLALSWEALAAVERQTNQPMHTVLRLKAEHAEMRSQQMAEHLTTRLGKAVTADWVRQTVRRARVKFAGLLVEEVKRSLKEPTDDQLYQELIDLDLLRYCRFALK